MSEQAQNSVKNRNPISRFWYWLTAHHSSIEAYTDQRLARLANSFTLAIALLMMVGLTAASMSSSFGEAFSGFGPPLITTILTYILTRTRYFRAGVFLFTLGFGFSAHLSIMNQGSEANAGMILLLFVPLSLVIANTFLSSRALILLTLLFSGVAGVLTFTMRLDASTGGAIGVVLATGFVLAFLNSYRDVSERIQLEKVQVANQELEHLKNELEQRVQERTTDLEQRSQELEMRSEELITANLNVERSARKFATVSYIARQISAIRDLKRLLADVTDLISRQFGFYHVGIFLLDEGKQMAVLSATNSEGGKKMLNRGHRLKVGEEGIVGYVTSTGTPRIALDTGADAVYFNNPDLPETHSEMAVPLRIGEQIIGALDIQDKAANAFKEDDIEVTTTLADLVSIAIENARLFEDSQQLLSEAQAITRQHSQQEWQALSKKQGLAGVHYTITGTDILRSPIQTPTIEKALAQGEIFVEKDQAEQAALAVPIKLRDQIIGVLNISNPNKESWTTDEIDIARAVAERLAISAENARLFEATSRRAERERMVSDITSKIRSTNDPQVMLQTALEELQKALGGAQVQIRPYEKPAIKTRTTKS